MSRQQDIARAQNPEGELRLARILDRVIGWSKRGWRDISCEKLPPAYYLDFAIVKDNHTIEAWLEVKERHAFYGDWLFPMAKWIEGKRMSEESGKPFYICFSYPDPKTKQECIIFMKVEQTHKPSVVWAGRKDRGYANDMFPHVELPHSWFTDITEYA